MTIVRLSDRLVERLVLDVIKPPAVDRSGRDRRRVPFVDELGEKIVGLLAVREARECAVLPFEEHAGEDQHMDQEPRLTLGEAKPHEGADARRTDAVA